MSPAPVLAPQLAAPPTARARGSHQGRNTKRIVIALDGALFDRISLLAAASRVSFAEAVRQLIEAGFQTHSRGRR